jgi:hypothetical protein
VCNDGNLCDSNDTCRSGACTPGSTVTCSASDQCHVAGTCNAATGQCSNPGVADGTVCNDGNPCDTNDACKAGTCTAGQVQRAALGDQWLVLTTHTMVPSADAIARTQARFEELAAEQTGEYDGWEAGIVRG